MKRFIKVLSLIIVICLLSSKAIASPINAQHQRAKRNQAAAAMLIGTINRSVFLAAEEYMKINYPSYTPLKERPGQWHAGYTGFEKSYVSGIAWSCKSIINIILKWDGGIQIADSCEEELHTLPITWYEWLKPVDPEVDKDKKADNKK